MASIRKVFSQPDLLIAIISIMFLVYQTNQDPLPVNVLFWITILLLESILIYAIEIYKVSQNNIIYRGRGIILWIIAVFVWMLVTGLTGGLLSPLLYFMILSILHYTRNPRQHRYIAAMFLLAGTSFTPWLYTNVLHWTIAEYTTTGVYLLILLISLVFLLIYGLFLAEYKPFDMELFTSISPCWAGSMTIDSFYRSILTRAMRLYQAEWGFVVKPEAQDVVYHNYRILLRAGYGLDDPQSNNGSKQKQEYISNYLSDIINRRKEFCSKNYIKPTIIPDIHKKIGSIYSFNLKRHQSKEVIAVFILFKKYTIIRPYLPQSLFYFEALFSEAKNVWETLNYISNYRKVLCTKSQEDFKTTLEATCRNLIPFSTGFKGVNIKLSNHRNESVDAIVPISIQLTENRKVNRWISVEAFIEQPDNFSLYTIYNYLQDVANSAILEQRLNIEEALNAADKGVIGLSNLEPPDEEFTQKIRDWDGNAEAYNTTFLGCGFRVLWVNRLMQSWFKDIPLDLSNNIQNPSGFYCYHHFNGKHQKGPCRGCPCLLLYRKYLLADDADKNKISESLEVRTSYSPAGKLKIIRHYELGASLVFNSFTPEEVSFIRETVIDRTLEIELLAILSHISEHINMQDEGSCRAEYLEDINYEVFCSAMSQFVVEGLGRSFHANHIFKAKISESVFDILDEYRCSFLYLDKAAKEDIVEKELGLLYDSSPIKNYFKTREMLFRPIKVRRNAASGTFDILRSMISSSSPQYGAIEIIKDSQNRELFEKTTCSEEHPDKRCIIIDIPFVGYKYFIFTGEPEGWEKSPDGKLLPREREMELCQAVGDVLGLLFESMSRSLKYRLAEKEKTVDAAWRGAVGAFAHRLGNVLPLAIARLDNIIEKYSSQNELIKEASIGRSIVAMALEIITVFQKHGIHRVLNLQQNQVQQLFHSLYEFAKTMYPQTMISLALLNNIDDEKILADQSALRDVMLYLISDSIRYHPSNKPAINMIIEYAKKDGANVLLMKYIDDGNGVPDNLKKKIFKPFFSTSGGNGIGLSDVKAIIHGHGGAIQENGKYTKGICFEIILPLI